MRLLLPHSLGFWSLVYYAIRHRDRVVVLAMALLTIPFLPASNLLFPVGTVIGERLLYLPSLGFCVLLTRGAIEIYRLISKYVAGCWCSFSLSTPLFHFRFPFSWFCRIAHGRGSRNRRYTYGWYAAIALLVALYAMRTLDRNRDWRSEETLFESALRVVPNSSKAQFNYAQVTLSPLKGEKSMI